ncbi:RFX-like DNA-binding protein RFX2 [Strongylocentrotus purpuratus]|uniref:Uncharacterized protein n=1 Tax=Strongylocentrotus purpuratus TaxID=7668 RepID=A0A7M7PN36_STRPU|nr:RFX-like DNA-binding protein RFX2 [Strongylocentrotus purpuratus]
MKSPIFSFLLYDDFYLELALLASSSKNPVFSNLMTRTTWYNEHRSRSVLQQYRSLGDVPTARSSQMINPHQGMTPTTRYHRQSATSGTSLPPAITYHHNQQHQTHVSHHLPFSQTPVSQTPVSQEAWQHPDQNRVGEPFLPFQQSRQQHQPIMSQSQELIENSHQQLYFARAPPQRETQNQLTHLSGSQQSEQPNQLARRLGEPQVHPCSQTAQHRLPQPLLMTEQPWYFSTTHSSYYDDQRHIINPQQPMIHMIQQPTLLSETSTVASLPPASQPSFHRTHVLHHPRQPHFSEFILPYRLPRASRDPQHPNTHHNTVYTSRSPQPRHQQSP